LKVHINTGYPNNSQNVVDLGLQFESLSMDDQLSFASQDFALNKMRTKRDGGVAQMASDVPSEALFHDDDNAQACTGELSGFTEPPPSQGAENSAMLQVFARLARAFFYAQAGAPLVTNSEGERFVERYAPEDRDQAISHARVADGRSPRPRRASGPRLRTTVQR
jgi:hypothetical protein